MSKRFGLNPQQAADLASPHTPSRLPHPTDSYRTPGGLPSAAGRHVGVEVSPGGDQATFSSSKGSAPGVASHLGGADIKVPVAGGQYGSTMAAEAAASYMKGSTNRTSPYDDPNSVIPPEVKVAAAVNPQIRGIEDAVGIRKHRIPGLTK